MKNVLAPVSNVSAWDYPPYITLNFPYNATDILPRFIPVLFADKPTGPRPFSYDILTPLAPRSFNHPFTFSCMPNPGSRPRYDVRITVRKFHEPLGQPMSMDIQVLPLTVIQRPCYYARFYYFILAQYATRTFLDSAQTNYGFLIGPLLP